MSALASLPVVDRELQTLLGSLLRTGSIDAIEREQNGFATKLGSEFVTVVGPTARRRFFLKLVSGDGGAHAPDPHDRELRVYQDLAAAPWFEAPAFLGAVREDTLLVLEAVDGWDLRYRDLDDWQVAAKALARVHAGSHGDLERISSLGYLLRRDAAFHLHEARAALAVAPELHALIESYDAVTAQLASLPASLVHGDLAPKNVLIDRSGGGRALFVDWEWAGIGTGLLDLVDLANGLAPEDERRLVATYVDEAVALDLLEPDDRAIELGVTAAQIQRIMFRLARGQDWGVSRADMSEWSRRAIALFARL